MTIGWTCRVTAPAVRLRGVGKRYGATTVLEKVSLDVPGRRFYGVLGAAGSGKTTLLGIASGQLRPDAGHVEIAGVALAGAPGDEPAAGATLVGVLRSDPRSADALTGAQLLETTGRLGGMSPEETEQRTHELAAALDLSDRLHTPVDGYTDGEATRMGLARVLMHRPPVVFLDEAFDQVDGPSAFTMRSALDAYVAQGGTVVLATEDAELVEQLCDTVAVVHRGAVLAHGRLDRVREGRSLAEAYAGLVRAADESGRGAAAAQPSAAVTSPPPAGVTPIAVPAQRLTLAGPRRTRI